MGTLVINPGEICNSVYENLFSFELFHISVAFADWRWTGLVPAQRPLRSYRIALKILKLLVPQNRPAEAMSKLGFKPHLKVARWFEKLPVSK